MMYMKWLCLVAIGCLKSSEAVPASIRQPESTIVCKKMLKGSIAINKFPTYNQCKHPSTGYIFVNQSLLDSIQNHMIDIVTADSASTLRKEDYPYRLNWFENVKEVLDQKAKEGFAKINQTNMAKNDREGLMKLDQAIRETEWHEAHVAASRKCITDLQRIFKFLVDEKNRLKEHGDESFDKKIGETAAIVRNTTGAINVHIGVLQRSINLKKQIRHMLATVFNLDSDIRTAYGWYDADGVLMQIDFFMMSLYGDANDILVNKEAQDMFNWFEYILVKPASYMNEKLNEKLFERIERKVNKIEKLLLKDDEMSREKNERLTQLLENQSDVLKQINMIKNSPADFKDTIMTEYGQPQFGLDNLDQLVFQYKKLIKDLMIYKDFLSDINHFQSFLMKQEERLNKFPEEIYEKRITAIWETIERSTISLHSYIYYTQTMLESYYDKIKLLTTVLGVCSRYYHYVSVYTFCDEIESAEILSNA